MTSNEPCSHFPDVPAPAHVDLVPCIMLQLDPQGQIVLLNRKGAEILGGTPEEFLGKNWFQTLIPEADRQRLQRAFQALLDGADEHIGAMDNAVITLQGQKRIIHWQNARLTTAEGSAAGVLCAGQDITVDQADEVRLSHFNAVLRGVRHVNQLITRDLPPTELIEQACTMLTATLGYRRCWIALREEERWTTCAAGQVGILDPSMRDTLCPQDRPAPACLERALNSTGPVVVREQEAACNGCPATAELRETTCISLALAHAGERYGAMGVTLPAALSYSADELAVLQEIAADIALALARDRERRQHIRLLTQLAENERERRNLAAFPSENPNPVMRIRTDGVLLYANAASRPLLTAWHLAVGRRAPEDVCALVAKVMKTGRPAYAEIAAGDAEFLLTTSGSSKRDYVNVYAIDITRRHILEMHLRNQQKLESIGTLASGVAHEINNPINGIMNYAQLIKDTLADGNSDLTLFADEIIHETERVATIVRNLLQFARHERESHSPACIEDIIRGTLSLIQTVVRHDQITLKIEIPPNLPMIKCRSQQIQQVLMNLMANARDALNARYPEYDPDKIMRVAVSEFNRDGRRWIRILVEDHGCGIASGIRDRLFDPFFTTKPRDVGTGLGLAISHGIVKDHHGALSFDSKINAYTRFYLDLPVDNGWQLESHRDA